MPEDHKAGLGFPHDPPRASHRTLATHTFQVACLPSRNRQPACCHPASPTRARPLEPPPSSCPPQGSLRFLQAPQLRCPWGAVLSPSSPSVQLHVHSEGSQRKPRDLREALSLGKQPLSRGLPPSEAIPTGMGLDHHGLVASTWQSRAGPSEGPAPTDAQDASKGAQV